MLQNRSMFLRYFQLTRYETRGLICLFVVLISWITFLYVNNKTNEVVIQNHFEVHDIPNQSTKKTKIKPSKGVTKSVNRSVDLRLQNKNTLAQKLSPPLSPINLNTISLDSLILLGFPKHKATNIINFRNSIDGFKNISELTKIYALNDADKEYLTAHGVIVIFKFCINTSDATTLQKIKGIGPVLSTRIVKYRESLGGFYSFWQLAEVYGVDSAKVAQWQNQLEFSTQVIQKIPIHKVSYQELKQHPYFNANQSKQMIKHLSKGGALDKESLMSVFRDENYVNKIYPYL